MSINDSILFSITFSIIFDKIDSNKDGQIEAYELKKVELKLSTYFKKENYLTYFTLLNISTFNPFLFINCLVDPVDSKTIYCC